MYYDDYTEEDRNLIAEAREKDCNDEVKAWEEVLVGTNPKLKTVIGQFLEDFKAGKYYEADNILLENFKYIEQDEKILHLLRFCVVNRSWSRLHPEGAHLLRQVELSQAVKPVVGDIVTRRFEISGDPDGTYTVHPAQLVKSDKGGKYVIRIQKSYEGWQAGSFQSPGIVTFCEKPDNVNWSHLKITKVGFRSCEAEVQYINFNEMVTTCAIKFHDVLRRSMTPSTKIKVKIEW